MNLVSIHRYRRDARSLDEDEELWFNDDDDEEDGEAVERRMDEDFSDSYEKFMEAKKGHLCCCECVQHPGKFVSNSRIPTLSLSVTAGASNGANNTKSAAIPASSPAVTSSNTSSSSVKTVALPATPVVKVTHVQKCVLFGWKTSKLPLFFPWYVRISSVFFLSLSFLVLDRSCWFGWLPWRWGRRGRRWGGGAVSKKATPSELLRLRTVLSGLAMADGCIIDPGPAGATFWSLWGVSRIKMRLLPFSVLNSALCSLHGRRWRASLERQIAPYFYSSFFFLPLHSFSFFFLIKSITVWEIQISSFLRKLHCFYLFFLSPLIQSSSNRQTRDMATQSQHPPHFCCCVNQGASALQPASTSVSKPNQWGRKKKPKPDQPAYELFSWLPRLAGLALRAQLAAADSVPPCQTPRDSGSIEMLTERGRRWIKTWMNSQPWRYLDAVERDSNVESHGISLGEGVRNTMFLGRIVFARIPAFHEFKYCTYVVSFPF